MLAYQDEQEVWKPTALGLAATRAVLPPALAAGVGQLVRDLLSLDSADRLLRKWRPLDSLLVVELAAERAPTLRRFSEDLAGHIDGWMEQHSSDVPLVFREWIAGAVGHSRADEVLGSLGVSLGKNGASGDEARKRGYLATLRAVVLVERGLGVPLSDITERWRLTELDGQEERWRDERLWLLSGMARILKTRCFYYHLKEECGADEDRVLRVGRMLREMRRQIYELRELLKFCSPLGPLVRSMKRTAGPGGAGVGLETMRCLEAGGIRGPADLVSKTADDLVALGVGRQQARRIAAYMRRRMQ
jgi:hypothetical protein